ncbi:hypothetical protein PNEG_00797 [Pneumocystis murina B123]|uniref:COP9 signalosome complex subunit 3 N-terminal helical repeats domain-containing protein n=1 Tax=Pneumocystis murina (strain B123) TaxID=1069680 RepID=M7NVP1_PNEMU|nr:hypothetical protein PNEG_00797 [Pneumocystis murina B123]EMR11206.1 hypothetical protein PNEG_00797 [Pneumocystis murina B123]
MNYDKHEFVSAIKKFINVEEIQNILIPYLKSLSIDILVRLEPQDPLKVLDPETYSIGYLYILLARVQISKLESIWEDCVTFLNVFNISLVSTLTPDEFKKILKWICDNANTIDESFLVIDVLKSTLERYPDFAISLTPVRTIFVKQCFITKAYEKARFILDIDVEIFDKNNGITYIDHLLYHFYGALLYIKLKLFDRALQFLRIIISAPTRNTSVIQVNAYKKFVILSLIVNGKMEPIPYITDSIATKTYKVFGKVYNEFSQAYERQDHQEIKDIYLKYRSVFIEDKNNKLIKYAINSLSYHEIYRFKEIYTSISIIDINRKIGPWDDILLDSQDSYNLTEKFISNMIQNGKLNAIITDYNSQRVVNFINTVYDKQIQKETLLKQAKDISILITKLSNLNCSSDLNDMYLAVQSSLSSQHTFYNNQINSLDDFPNIPDNF